MPAKHGDIPNAYVKADKDKDMNNYLCISQGMELSDEVMIEHGVDNKKVLAVRPFKSLYGLKQAGRLWSRLLHDKLEEAGFTRCNTDMCLYFKRSGCDITIVGV